MRGPWHVSTRYCIYAHHQVLTASGNGSQVGDLSNGEIGDGCTVVRTRYSSSSSRLNDVGVLAGLSVETPPDVAVFIGLRRVMAIIGAAIVLFIRAAAAAVVFFFFLVIVADTRERRDSLEPDDGFTPISARLEAVLG